MTIININTETITRFEFEHAITSNPDGTYTLHWGDLVANSWDETFPTLSATLARLATLVACGEANWKIGFANNPDNFLASAELFFAEEAG